jgi:hypothetical protein
MVAKGFTRSQGFLRVSNGYQILLATKLRPSATVQASPNRLINMPASVASATARRAMRRNVFAAGMRHAAQKGVDGPKPVALGTRPATGGAAGSKGRCSDQSRIRTRHHA